MITTIAATTLAWAILMVCVSSSRTMLDVYFNRFVVLVVFGSIAVLIYQFLN